MDRIYSWAGMTREINDCKQEMSFPRKLESINLKKREATARLYVGADLCARPKKNKRTREQESEN
jgi:hypothetical protein